MRTKNLLKVTLTALAVMMITGAFAQGNATDYGLISADANTSYVTLDATIPLYVEPDGIYHPSWTTFSSGLTAGFTWVFSGPGIISADITLNQPSSLNYVEITGNTIGTYAVNVYELAPTAYGGCHDVGRDFDIVVTGKPTATISGSNTGANAWTEVTENHSYYACGDKAAETITVGITEENVPVALQGYAYRVEKLVENIDINGVNPVEVSKTNIINHTIDTKGNTGSIGTGDLEVVGGERTRYTYTLSPATDAPAGITGIVSAVSHKSDYLKLASDVDDFTNYPFNGTLTVVYIVNPAPSTGPIYHIPNNFGL